MKATSLEAVDRRAAAEGVEADASAETSPAPPMPDTWPWVDRRSGTDRRNRPTRWYDSLLGHRRRKRGRRKGESRNIYVDIYHSGDLILVAAVFLLNLVDAGLTLHHLSEGAVEQNPLMDRLIAWGAVWFLLEKALVVGLCLVALAVHKTFPLARRGAYALLVVYSLLMIQHISLL
jgi:hypothetical protein